MRCGLNTSLSLYVFSCSLFSDKARWDEVESEKKFNMHLNFPSAVEGEGRGVPKQQHHLRPGDGQGTSGLDNQA
jgi:hypothetical protein